MKKLSLSFNGASTIYDIVRVQVYNKGEYNDTYVYLNNKAQAQALAFYPHADFCSGVWVSNPDKDYNYIVRLQLPMSVDITTDEDAQVKITPILKQYYDLKARHPDALLLFRTGDFYETYSEDAREVAKTLGITLTRSTMTKDKDGKGLNMAGFPYHALDTYLPKLIRTGHRVAICDQIEKPMKK